MQPSLFNTLKKVPREWGFTHYISIVAFWTAFSYPLYLCGWGWFSLLALPTFVAFIVAATIPFSSAPGRPIPMPAPNERIIPVYLKAYGFELPVHITMLNPEDGPQESSLQTIAALHAWGVAERKRIFELLIADATLFSEISTYDLPLQDPGDPLNFAAPNSVEKQAKFDRVLIDETDEFQNRFALLECDPEWEVEHGRVIIIRNNQPLVVCDYQDDLRPFDNINPPTVVTTEADRKFMKIRQILGYMPSDLASYFARLETEAYAALTESHGIKLLDENAVARETESWIRDHPIAKALGGLVLDDANTSNFHLYLTRSPLKGQVLHLSHDGDTRVVYASLDDFLDAAKSLLAMESGTWEDIHPECTPLSSAQEDLYEFAGEALAQGDTELLPVLISSMLVRDTELTRLIARNRDFFLPEALADQIAKRPARNLLELAKLCAAHAHPQAARAGERACEVITRLT